jgi:Family of unknown function (DUF6519)
MKADIGRDTFDPTKRFLRVVMQQGRVQVASDWNERDALVYQAIRRLAADLIGPWGGSPGAFRVTAAQGVRSDFTIGAGHYWVDGVLCDNPTVPGATVTYMHQPYYPVPDNQRLTGAEAGQALQYLVYLDVWERLVTANEDEDIREVALGGPDTAARTEVVWQVRAGELDRNVLDGATCDNMPDRWPGLLELLRSPYRGRLRARARTPHDALDDPCAIDPQAAYRGEENALFRVEVHRPGPADSATFKWSSGNAADAFPVDWFGGNLVRVATLGRDGRSTLEAGDWVELESDTHVLQQRAEPLFKVVSVDTLDLTVRLDPAPAPVAAGEHPRLRRWDQKGTSARPLESDGTIKITEAASPEGGWIDLADGVQVQFVAATGGSPAGPVNRYRSGDFWQFPARTRLRDVIWPQETTAEGRRVPAARPPNGVEHRYAPLAWVAVAGDGTVSVVQRFVRTITPVATCVPGPDGL